MKYLKKPFNVAHLRPGMLLFRRITRTWCLLIKKTTNGQFGSRRDWHTMIIDNWCTRPGIITFYSDDYWEVLS